MTNAQAEPPLSAEAKTAGRICIILAAVLWSTSGLFAKATIFADWAPETRGTLLAFWRALFAGLLILPAVRRPRWNPRLVPMALVFAGMNVTYLTALTLTTAANAIWLQNTAPWWVFLLGTLLFHEPVQRRDLTTMAFALLGVALILGYEIGGESQAGVMCGLASAVGYALVILFLRSLRDENAAWLVVVNHLMAAAILLPPVIYLQVWPSALQLGILAAFGFIQMGLPYTLFARGLKSVPSQEAAALGLLEPILLPIWVYLAWGEVPSWWTMAGGAFILVGLAVRYRKR